MNNYYNKNLKDFARENRKSMTKASVRLWCELLRGKKMLDYPFKRERPIDRFIVDFVCLKLKLVIEADGWTHESEKAALRDSDRDRVLNELGFTVLRFSNWEIEHDITTVDMIIRAAICQLESSLIASRSVPPKGHKKT